MQLQRDNEVLLKIESEDKWRIKELLALSQDFENENPLDPVLPEDWRPNDTLEIEKSKTQWFNEKKKFVNDYNKTVKTAKARASGKVKTIFLPHEDVNKLWIEIEWLKTHQ